MKKTDKIMGINPFKVPDNYFEDVNRKIISATAGTVNETNQLGLSIRLRPYLAIAASVAVLVLLSYTAVKIFLPAGETEFIPEISMQEFSESYLNDIDILTLEEITDPLFFSEEMPEVSKSEIIDYLMLENIDINEIYELL